MNIKGLEAFLAVIDHNTMSAAATALFTSQPNISLMISDLEKEYSTKLFERVAKKLYLTSDGKKLEKHARVVMDALKQLNEDMLDQQKTIRIGSSVTVGQYLLNEYLQKLKSDLPHVTFEVIISNTSEIETLLLTNRIDVGIVEGAIHSKRLTQVELLQDELIAIIHPAYAFDTIPEKLTDLARLPWISREEGSQDRNQFEVDMTLRKIYPQVTFRATNLQTIIQAVENGYGFAIVSKLAAQTSLDNKRIRHLTFSDYSCPRSIRYIYSKNQKDNILISQFLECIHGKLQDSPEETCS